MEKNKFTHGSLFSGIGGPEIAAEEMGWKNMFHCEINPFGRKILDYWFPNSKSYEDITKTNFTEWRGKINVLTGGFPCQPFSCAGQRKGAEDDRYLWPEMLRAIREIQPDWTNKMFVKADLMPRHIEFTDRKVERLQDISDEDCLKEGIYEDSGDDEFPPSIFYEFEGNKDNGFDTPREAFAALIDKVSGKGTWESNPYVWAYEFELMK